MGVNEEILKQLKIEQIHIKTNKEIIKKAIKEKFGYELPLTKDILAAVGDENRVKLIEVVNISLRL